MFVYMFVLAVDKSTTFRKYPRFPFINLQLNSPADSQPVDHSSLPCQKPSNTTRAPVSGGGISSGRWSREKEPETRTRGVSFPKPSYQDSGRWTEGDMDPYLLNVQSCDLFPVSPQQQ